MVLSPRPLALVAALLMMAPARAAEPPREFAGRQWSIDVPAGYGPNEARLNEQMITTVFAPEPRADGTRPMVQVTLADLRQSSQSPEFAAKFAETMIGSVQRRREEWKVEKSADRVGDVSVTRYVWSGVSIPAADGAAIRARVRGVMLVGIDKGIGFVLHTQDVDEHAASIETNEKVLRTFRIR